MPSLGMRRDRLEALMETGARKYKSDFARRHYERGWAEGMAEGMLTVLSARGIDVPERARVQITECTDLAQLEAWLHRAVTIASVDELFEH
jgi:hypothetical protein